MLELLLVLATFTGIVVADDVDSPLAKANRIDNKIVKWEAKLEKGFTKNMTNTVGIWNSQAVNRAEIKVQKIADKVVKLNNKIAEAKVEAAELRARDNNGRYTSRKTRHAGNLTARAAELKAQSDVLLKRADTQLEKGNN